MAQRYTLSIFCQIWFWLLGFTHCECNMLRKWWPYRNYPFFRPSRERFLCCTLVYLLVYLLKRILSVRTLVCPCASWVYSVSFFKAGLYASNDIWRRILHTYSKSRPCELNYGKPYDTLHFYYNFLYKTPT